MTPEYDIIIAGAGPAGSAAAIQIANLDAAIAGKTLVLEKAIFPRPKLCGGGVTPHADALLNKLGVTIDVPSFAIHAVRFRYQGIQFTFPWKDIFRVVRREEFDMALANCAKDRGVAVNEGEALVGVQVEKNSVLVQTVHRTYRTRVLIGADGANSSVRQKLGLIRSDRISRLIEVLTPVDAGQSSEFVEHIAVFDFSRVADGNQGYYWDFPSLKQSEPMMNRGIFDSRVHPQRDRSDLAGFFRNALEQRHLHVERSLWRGHPERWFDHTAKHSAPHVILAGDAAGTEPYFGEGISHALDFGMFAAKSAARALAKNEFEFVDYEPRIAMSALGRRLILKRLAAQLAYAKHTDMFYRAGFTIARTIFGE